MADVARHKKAGLTIQYPELFGWNFGWADEERSWILAPYGHVATDRRVLSCAQRHFILSFFTICHIFTF